PTSSARAARGREPRAARGAGARLPAGGAAAAQSRAGAAARHQGALQDGGGGAGAPQLRHVSAVGARSGGFARRGRRRRGARSDRPVPARARRRASQRSSHCGSSCCRRSCSSRRSSSGARSHPATGRAVACGGQPADRGAGGRRGRRRGAAVPRHRPAARRRAAAAGRQPDPRGRHAGPRRHHPLPRHRDPPRAGGPAAGGAVDPGVATTDRSGTLRVRVTVGERAGPVVVSAKVGPLSRTATVYADPGLARELVLERGSAPLVGQLSLASRDTVVLRVSARDAHGNRTALEEFAATTSGRAIELRSTVMADSAAVVTLAPRRSGTGELELSGSGVRTRVSVTVALIGVQGGAWAIGARSAWLGSNDPWIALPNLTGMSGADWSVFGRRTLVGGLSLALGGAGGSLSAERTTGNVSLTLVEGYGRAELALAPRGAVSPVLALGGGVYRLKSADGGQTVFHTSTFWSGGGGLDVAVSPSVTLELRVERHWMWDTDLWHVATLWPLAAGVRAGLWRSRRGRVRRGCAHR